MEASVNVRQIKTFETKSGNTGYVLVDEKGNEYTTFRPEIGRSAQGAEGKPARIRYHETERRIPHRLSRCRRAARRRQ